MDHKQTMPSIGQRFFSDHQRLDALFQRLLAAVHSGDWSVCQSTWTRFERELLEHLEAEEVYLLPSFEREYPSEAAVLRREHATIRYFLADTGVRLELHAVREENVQRFVEFLKAHAATEERLLYRWTKDLPAATVEALAQQHPSFRGTAAHDGVETARR